MDPQAEDPQQVPEPGSLLNPPPRPLGSGITLQPEGMEVNNPLRGRRGWEWAWERTEGTTSVDEPLGRGVGGVSVGMGRRMWLSLLSIGATSFNARESRSPPLARLILLFVVRSRCWEVGLDIDF